MVGRGALKVAVTAVLGRGPDGSAGRSHLIVGPTKGEAVRRKNGSSAVNGRQIGQKATPSRVERAIVDRVSRPM